MRLIFFTRALLRGERVRANGMHSIHSLILGSSPGRRHRALLPAYTLLASGGLPEAGSELYRPIPAPCADSSRSSHPSYHKKLFSRCLLSRRFFLSLLPLSRFHSSLCFTFTPIHLHSRYCIASPFIHSPSLSLSLSCTHKLSGSLATYPLPHLSIRLLHCPSHSPPAPKKIKH
ncbi:hypothetical protein EDD21DRAFT_122817 [Dissophora ornata]|nr:hypothetical protein EDD21DRAFT_122817 [Dissophora ornata]